MSDDDLWRRKDADRQPGDEAESTDEPEHAGTDETQPITGTSPSPPPGPTPDSPPPPPSPSYHQPTGPGAVPPPQNPYAQSSGQQQNPYGGQPAAGQPYPTQPGPYAGQPYGGQPYGGQPYGAPPNPYRAPGEYTAPQSPYGSPYHPAYAGGMVPDHPSATTSMVLGIIGLVGIFVCAGITLILSPAAWIVGAKAVREIDATPGRYGGRDRAQAGKIMGIIGTVLLALGIVAIIGVVALAVSSGSNDPTPITPNPTFQNG